MISRKNRESFASDRTKRASGAKHEDRAVLARGLFLLLFAWFLVIPPTDDNVQILKERPISHWNIFATFDSRKECTQAQKSYADFLRCTPEMAEDINRRKPPELKTDCTTMPDLLLSGQCVRSDDPRLNAP